MVVRKSARVHFCVKESAEEKSVNHFDTEYLLHLEQSEPHFLIKLFHHTAGRLFITYTMPLQNTPKPETVLQGLFSQK